MERVPLKYRGEVIGYADVDLETGECHGYVTEDVAFVEIGPEQFKQLWEASITTKDGFAEDCEYIPIKQVPDNN